MNSILAVVVPFVLSVALIPLVRRVCLRKGWVAQPRPDRWNKQPTPRLGGIAVFLAFIGGVFASGALDQSTWVLLVGSTLMFILGLLDDFITLNPPTKLIGQFLAAALLVFLGFRINFFQFELFNILLAFFWLVGITNAINLLDNMDGVAGGISLIVAGMLAFLLFSSIEHGFALLALSLAGATAGFLIYNFPPASIYMGDSGSLFLGFSLAALAMARQPRASNVIAVMGVPLLIFLLPILDTTLVTITRLMRGVSPSVGGKDHTSHRLVAFGLSERQVFFALCGVALLSGIVGTFAEYLSYDLSLVFVPILILALGIFTAYLGQIKVVSGESQTAKSTMASLVARLTYRRRLFEVILDFFIISIAYYLALWMQLDLRIHSDDMRFFLNTLPLAVAVTYVTYFVLGIYRGFWQYLNNSDFWRYAISALVSVVIVSLGLIVLYGYRQTLLAETFLFGIFLLLGTAGSRLLFQLLDQFYKRRQHAEGTRVLIYGAGSSGVLALRWLTANKESPYIPIGFVDDDAVKKGRSIYGYTIYGGLANLETILQRTKPQGLIITIPEKFEGSSAERITALCRANHCWVRILRVEFDLITE